MTLYAVPGGPADSPAVGLAGEPVVELEPVPASGRASELERGRRPELRIVAECDHDWRLVQVHFSDGASVREYTCADCAAVWFA